MLADVIASGDPVIATGGGAVTHGDNLALMRAAGFVVALGVDVAEAARARRAAAAAAGLLLARRGELAAHARAPIYRRAHAVVDTTGRSARRRRRRGRRGGRARVARRAGREPIDRRARRAQLPDQRRRCACRRSARDPRARCPASRRGSRSSPTTASRRHWLRAPRPLDRRGAARISTITLDPGEASKSFATYERICAQLVAAGLDRGSAIVALGGGVVGDLAGFVAATYMRGIRIVQHPTTLVAMTDAAIGGKTAIDLPAGKNLVGAFHQPMLVACALATLTTLPARERRAGFGELWKYALLDGDDLWTAVDVPAPWAAEPTAAPPPPSCATSSAARSRTRPRSSGATSAS